MIHHIEKPKGHPKRDSGGGNNSITSNAATSVTLPEDVFTDEGAIESTLTFDQAETREFLLLDDTWVGNNLSNQDEVVKVVIDELATYVGNASWFNSDSLEEYITENTTSYTGSLRFSNCPLLSLLDVGSASVAGRAELNGSGVGLDFVLRCGALGSSGGFSLDARGGVFNPNTFSTTATSFSAAFDITNSTNTSFVADDLVSGATRIDMSGSSGLTYASMASLVSFGGSKCELFFDGCALTQASVDRILRQISTNNGGSPITAVGSKILRLDGGTNATPSAAGLVNKGILEADGWTVTTN